MTWEFQLLWGIQHHLTSAWGDAVMIGLSTAGNNGAVWILLGLILLLVPRWRRAGLAVLLALLVAHIVGNLGIKPLVARPRPFLADPSIMLKIVPPMEFSFPSGHSITAFAAAFAIPDTLRVLRKSAIILAVSIAFSRLYLFMHFPTDVLAGAIMGAAIGHLVTRKIHKAQSGNVDNISGFRRWLNGNKTNN